MDQFKISQFLSRRKNAISIKDNIEYKRVTIRGNHKGVLLRDTKKGIYIGTKKQFLIKNGQFILSKIDAMNGAFGIVPNDLDNAIITGNFWTFDVDTSKLNIEWFRLLTKSKFFIDLCINSSSGTTHRRYLDEKKFSNYELNLPTKKKQDRFVMYYSKIADKYNKYKDDLNWQENLIKKLRQAILSEAVSGKLVSQDPSDEPASKLLEKIKAEKENLIKQGEIRKEKPLPPITEDEIPYELPKGWEWVRLMSISVFKSGKTFNKCLELSDNGVPYIKVADMNLPQNQTIINTSSRFIKLNKQNKNNLIEENSVIFPKRGGAIATNKKRLTKSKIFVDLNTMAITPNKNIVLKYFIHWFSNFNLWDLNNGTSVPQINNKDFEPLLFPLPSLSEQKRIVEKVDKLMKLCDELEKQVKENQVNAERLMNAVLREAFEQ